MPAEIIKQNTIFIILCFWLLCLNGAGNASAQTGGVEPMATDARIGSESRPDRIEVHLFFTDDRNYYLRAEKRTLSMLGDPVSDGRQIITQLLQGPKEELHRIVPAETQLRSFFVTPDGTAYADFTDALRDHHPGGARAELLTVFGIVNSLILNIEEIKQVVLLIEGQEALTLAGHIDTRYPYKADMLLIR